jgi:hypothetical protein
MSLRRILFACSILLLLIPYQVQAGGRVEYAQEEITEYIWHIIGPDGLEFCRIITDTETGPALALVRALCGDFVADQLSSGQMYINLLTTRMVLRNIPVHLDGIKISLSISRRSNPPLAVIHAVDPLPGEEITRLELTINGHPHVCQDNPCSVPLRYGEVELEYWAESSYGDDSGVHVALIRLGDVFTVIGDRTYSSWTPEHRVPNVWMTFPPSNPPEWLKNAPDKSLWTDRPYRYLAGKTILSGSLGVPECGNFGIVPYSGGYASDCGLDFALEAVSLKQNTYNEEIMRASHSSGVPPWILKGIIAQESQFWPEAYGHYGEQGLFQLSRIGTDTLLRWSGDSYISFCSEIFEDCELLGYDNRADWEKEVLISAVMAEADDIDLLGDVLTANAVQVARLLENYLGVTKPGEILSYEELWKLTIINYHAGPEFTAAVLHQVKQRDVEVNWYQMEKAIKQLNFEVYKYLSNVINLWIDLGEKVERPY